MPHYFIACDFEPDQTTNGIWNRCRVDESHIFNQQQIIEAYGGVLTIEEAQYSGEQMFLIFAMVWGFKMLGRVLSLR